MAYIWAAEDNVEPISDSNIEGIANMANYSILSGCGQTYSALNMEVTIAAGTAIYNGAPITVAGNVVTLVADGSNPRWTWIVLESDGTADIVSGDAAAVPAVPELGGDIGIALVLIPAGQTIADDITYKLDKRVFMPVASNLSGQTTKYKTATQTVSASTALVDVTASAGTFSFAIAANEIWLVDYFLLLNFTGTGGFKAQVAGPATPTAVVFKEIGTRRFTTDITTGATTAVVGARASVTAFATNIAAADALTGVSATEGWENGVANAQWLLIRSFVSNGANAGTVTLQAAQNTANGTVVIGVGSTMNARKVA